MRRIGFILGVCLTIGLFQGCSTTDHKKSAQQSPSSIEPGAYSSKGGSAAKPGTVTVNFTRKPSTRTAKAPAPKPAPAPVKQADTPKSVSVATPAPAPKPVEVKAEPVKPAPPPKPAPAVKQTAPAAQPSEESAITISPYSSKGGTAVKSGTSTANLTHSGAPVPAPAPAPKGTAAAPAPKPVINAAIGKPGQNLGVVRQVNNEYKFIVIEFEGDKPLTPGTPLQVWRKGKLIGRATLDAPLEHWPLGVATLNEGSPEKEDTVTQ